MNKAILLCLGALLNTGVVCAMEDEVVSPIEPKYVTIPLPQGQKMEFALVRVADAENVFSAFDYEMGESADAGFPTKSVPTRVGGSVFVDKSYWAIPMARTEVTRAQYAAVMSPDSMPDKESANLPQTNISKLEMLNFIEKLNVWLQTDEKARSVMASIGSADRHGTPYVILPHESEWEFAARGGTHVSFTQFMDDIPYEDEDALVLAENLASQRGGKIKAVASTGKTNPAGLYDMFGNVEEMVQDTFRPEYSFGRTGADVVRGGSFNISPVKATSYLRHEVPVFDFKKAAPYKSNNLGFRLSMGSEMLSSALVGKIDQEWEEYAENSTTISPGDSGSKSTADKLALDGDRLEKTLEVATAQLAKNPESVKALQKLESASAIAEEMKKKVEAAEKISSKAGLELLYSASYSSYRLAFDRILNDVAWVLSQGKDQENFNTLKKMHEDLTKSMEGDKNNMALGCETLMSAGESVLNTAYDERLAAIVAKEGVGGDNSKLLLISKDVAVKAIKTGRVSGDLLKSWQEGIDNIAWDIYARKAKEKNIPLSDVTSMRQRIEQLKKNPVFSKDSAAASSSAGSNTTKTTTKTSTKSSSKSSSRRRRR